MKSVKTVWKLSIDAVMLILMMLMYSKNVISLTFHEIGGLVVLCIMLVHLLINGTWVKAVTKKLFSRTIPLKTKISWIVDFFLLICTIVMFCTSLLISKKLFPAIGNHNFLNPVHFCTAAVFLILIGIHFGLHFRFIVQTVCGTIYRAGKLLKIGTIILLLAVSGYGIKNVVSTSFGRWLSAPFTANFRLSHSPDADKQQYAGRGSPERNSAAKSDSAGIPSTSGAESSTSHQQVSLYTHPVRLSDILLLFVRMFSIVMLSAFIAFCSENVICLIHDKTACKNIHRKS